MKLLCLLLLLILLTSCSTKIDYHMATTRFDTPEVSGGLLDGSVEWNVASSRKVILGEVWTNWFIFSSATTYDDQYIESSINYMNLSFELGLLPILDIYQDSHWDSPAIYGVKIQLFGSSRKEVKEGMKVALKLGLGSANGDKESNVYTDSDGVTTSSVESEMSIDAYEAAMIVGYRTNQRLIWYLNSFYQYYKVESELVKDGVTELTANGISRNYGLLAGMRFGETLHASVEGGYTKSSYESYSTDGAVVGLEFGYSW